MWSWVLLSIYFCFFLPRWHSFFFSFLRSLSWQQSFSSEVVLLSTPSQPRGLPLLYCCSPKAPLMKLVLFLEFESLTWIYAAPMILAMTRSCHCYPWWLSVLVQFCCHSLDLHHCIAFLGTRWHGLMLLAFQLRIEMQKSSMILCLVTSKWHRLRY